MYVHELVDTDSCSVPPWKYAALMVQMEQKIVAGLVFVEPILQFHSTIWVQCLFGVDLEQLRVDHETFGREVVALNR